MLSKLLILVVLVCGLFPLTTIAQELIQEIPFDSIPSGTKLLGSSIVLDGPVEVSGELEAQSGVKFSDGTLQTTAATGSGSSSGLHGLYNNRIVLITLPEPFTEVCFKNDGMEFDIHGSNESTAGGDCQPGDIGWLIERFERESGTTASWASARASCLQVGMRLPEPFEWSYVCPMADVLAVSGMTTGSEWASNSTSQARINRDSSSDRVYQAAFAIGSGSCLNMESGVIARTDGVADSNQYRCVR